MEKDFKMYKIDEFLNLVNEKGIDNIPKISFNILKILKGQKPSDPRRCNAKITKFL